MAEFCLDCWNKLNGTNDPESKYRISKNLDLCEGCGEWKPVIVSERGHFFKRTFLSLLFSIRILYYKLLVLPNFTAKRKHQKKKQ